MRLVPGPRGLAVAPMDVLLPPSSRTTPSGSGVDTNGVLRVPDAAARATDGDSP